MTTAERLEGLTDRGKFDNIVASYIRCELPRYAAIMEMGTNAAGETVKSRLDGFCMVPCSSPPHFVLVEHTTADSDSLEKKWLFDHTVAKQQSGRKKLLSESDDGDLLKAGREAADIRKAHPGAKFTVILSTNERLNNKSELANAVYAKATALQMECEIIEQSRLTHFLDNTRNGHWIRKKELGVAAELLSRPLLVELSQHSAEAYSGSGLFMNPPANIEERDIDKAIADGVSDSGASVILLVGGSGMGKSTSALSALKTHLASGCGLWISGEQAQTSLSLINTVEAALKTLHPMLDTESAHSASEVLNPGERLMLVVDDINSLHQRARALSKLCDWLRIDTNKSQPPPLPAVILCPVWPDVMSASDLDVQNATWVKLISVGLMAQCEAKELIRNTLSGRGVSCSEEQAARIATTLGRDPILLGMFCSLTKLGAKRDLDELSQGVIASFIQREFFRSQESAGSNCLCTEYERAVSILCERMLTERQMSPTWGELQAWFSSDNTTLNALRELAKGGHLIRTEGRVSHLAFRHDRIREYLLAASMGALLKGEDPDDVGEDPYYSDIAGMSVVQTGDKALLQVQAVRNPLSIFCALSHSPSHDILNEIKITAAQWTQEELLKGRVSDAVYWEICRRLAETDCPAVIEITNGWPDSPFLQLARLRNGHVASGVAYCATYVYATPSCIDPARDQSIEMALKRHKEVITRDLQALLADNSSTDISRAAALILAGYLALRELSPLIAECWHSSFEPSFMLSQAIWALARCGGECVETLFRPLLDYWLTLSDKEDKHGMSPRFGVAYGLHHAFARGVSSAAVQCLTSLSDKYDDIQHEIAYMLTQVDNPDAVEFCIRRYSKYCYTFTYDPWDPARSGGRLLSAASRARAKTMWTNKDNGDDVRLLAFRVWSKSASSDELPTIRAVDNMAPHYRSAIWVRAKLCDASVVPELCELAEKDTYNFHVAHHVWSSALKDLVDKHMQSLSKTINKEYGNQRPDINYELSELMLLIPANEAEELLMRHWSHLKYCRLFIQVALFVGTPKTLALAGEAIDECPPGWSVFEHISMNAVFTKTELRDKTTEKTLNALVPHLALVKQDDIRLLAMNCQFRSLTDWSRRHLYPLMDNANKRMFHPADEDLRKDLDGMLSDDHVEMRVHIWIEDFARRGESEERALQIVRCWLADQETIEGLRVGAASLRRIGTRSDLLLLDRQYAGDAEELAELRSNTVFVIRKRSLQ